VVDPNFKFYQGENHSCFIHEKSLVFVGKARDIVKIINHICAYYKAQN